jgi:hypothetical protein
MTFIWSPRSTVSASPNVVSCELDGDSVLLNLDTSRYFRLNSVGSLLWSKLEAPCTVSELQDAVVEGFDVEPDRCARDIEALLSSLVESGLVTIADGTAS